MLKRLHSKLVKFLTPVLAAVLLLFYLNGGFTRNGQSFRSIRDSQTVHFSRLGKVFAERKEHAVKACSRLVKQGYLRKPNINETDIFWSYHLVQFDGALCYALFKCASTSLPKYFSKLSDREYYDQVLSGTNTHITNVRHKYKDFKATWYYAKETGRNPWQLLAKSHPKIVFVRNPLDRLLSAWNNKLRNLNESEPYMFEVAQYIRREILNETGSAQPTGLSLFEIMKYLTLENPKHLDFHFKPQYLMANPCAIKYDLIGTVENLKEEAEYVAAVLTKAQPEKFVKMDFQLNPSNYSSGRYDLLRAIPRSLVESVLKDRFRVDYEVFPYDLDADLEKVYGTS